MHAHKCQFCPNKVEDEIHFLTECTYYQNRNTLFTAVTNTVPNFPYLNSQEKIIFLMTQENKKITQKLFQTVHIWFLTKREQYKIIKTSLTQMQLTLKRIRGNQKTIRQEIPRQLEVSKRWKNGLGFIISRNPPSYVIIAKLHDSLKLKMTSVKTG